MYQYSSTIFNQLLSFLPKYRFKNFVSNHNADRYAKTLSTWNQLVVLLYAQATGKDSLREIETGFSLQKGSWHHLGVKTVARSSLADANKRRDAEIFEKLFYALLDQCKDITPSDKFKFKNPLYSFDSTTINLCLSLFDWAKYRRTKGALKLHMLLNNRTAIPELVNITEGKVADVTVFKTLNLKHFEKGSVLVFDRGYIDFEWWQEINKAELFFVSRIKVSQNIFVTGQHKKPLEKGILADDYVILGESLDKYPDELRQVRYWDENQKKEYIFITNNFELQAKQIADIYKARWQIELFFKWIKQNLKIKTFLGTSKNAVLTQIWIAMIYYLLLSYIKFQTKFKKSLLELTRMVKEVLLLRRDLIDLLSLEEKTIFKIKKEENPQLSLW